MEIIRFQNVKKNYDNKNEVINDLSFTVNEGEFITLIGKSGCGKTTLLKLINGLIKCNGGKVYIKGKEINDWDIIELRRSIGYVIQQIGLFPHMNIRDNITYVLDIKNIPKEERYKKAEELIELVGLEKEYLERFPRELSGGQKQRVGVARALASNPDIILMDEPFGAVDDITRRVLQDEILSLQKKLKKTIIFVTHDIEEAFKLGSRIVLLDEGKIVQEGSKESMLFDVKNPFAENFFGLKNFIAYLNYTTIYEFINRKNDLAIIEHRGKRNIRKIFKDAPLMEAIKIFFESGDKNIEVEDIEGNVVGTLSLNDIYSR